MEHNSIPQKNTKKSSFTQNLKQTLQSLKFEPSQIKLFLKIVIDKNDPQILYAIDSASNIYKIDFKELKIIFLIHLSFKGTKTKQFHSHKEFFIIIEGRDVFCYCPRKLQLLGSRNCWLSFDYKSHFHNNTFITFDQGFLKFYSLPSLSLKYKLDTKIKKPDNCLFFGKPKPYLLIKKNDTFTIFSLREKKKLRRTIKKGFCIMWDIGGTCFILIKKEKEQDELESFQSIFLFK